MGERHYRRADTPVAGHVIFTTGTSFYDGYMKANGTIATKGKNALIELRQRLIQNPNDGEALYAVGQAYASQNEIGLALSFTCQAVASEHHNAEYYTALGTLLARNER